MPRAARIVIPNVPHHLTQRGNNRQDVFFNIDDRRVYLEILHERCFAAGVGVLGYCLMTNHVHLIVLPPGAAGLADAGGRWRRGAGRGKGFPRERVRERILAPAARKDSRTSDSRIRAPATQRRSPQKADKGCRVRKLVSMDRPLGLKPGAPLGRCGHLWQGRFHSCPLDDTHLWTALAYIERNPVRAKLTRRAWLWP